MTNFQKFLAVCIIPQLLLIAVLTVSFTTGVSPHLLVGISMLGELVWMAGAFGFVILDSRRRWPGTKASERFERIITFHRE